MATKAGGQLLGERKAEDEGLRLLGRRLGNTPAPGLSLSFREGGAGWQRGSKKWRKGDRPTETRTQAEKQEGTEIGHTYTQTDKCKEQR